MSLPDQAFESSQKAFGTTRKQRLLVVPCH
jgi:hypothetical protein